MSWQEQPSREHAFSVKESFAAHYKELLGDGYGDFISCSMRYLRRAIRVNTLKASVSAVRSRLEKAGWELTPVPWCPEAFWISGDRLDIGNLLEHQLGYVYVQDPASMLPPIVLAPEAGERVLDMCASPGSKTSQAAAMMKNEGIIVANDVQGSRLAPLGINLQRLGVVNAVLTKRDGRGFTKMEFDRIMVDAPCSGTGTIRRSPKSITMWNPKQVDKLGRLQEQLLDAAWKALKHGGVMTYSTCTLEPRENEVVLSRFLSAHPDAACVPIELDIDREKNWETDPESGEALHPGVKNALRIHPTTNDTEGFFVARIEKE